MAISQSTVATFRRQQARKKARYLISLVQGSAALEGQAVDAATVRRVERQIEEKLLAGPALRLWA